VTSTRTAAAGVSGERGLVVCVITLSDLHQILPDSGSEMEARHLVKKGERHAEERGRAVGRQAVGFGGPEVDHERKGHVVEGVGPEEAHAARLDQAADRIGGGAGERRSPSRGGSRRRPPRGARRAP
jgi:hypothetical protein